MTNLYNLSDYPFYSSRSNSLVIETKITDQVPLDLISTSESYEIWVDVPGFKRDAIKVTILDRILTISGKESSIKNQDNLKISRRPESFSYQIKLQSPVDVSKTQTKLEDGVLYLKFFKTKPDEEINIPLS